MVSKRLEQKAEDIITRLREFYSELPEERRPAVRDYLLGSVGSNKRYFQIHYFRLGESLLEQKIEDIVNQINSLNPDSSKSGVRDYLKRHAKLAQKSGFPCDHLSWSDSIYNPQTKHYESQEELMPRCDKDLVFDEKNVIAIEKCNTCRRYQVAVDNHFHASHVKAVFYLLLLQAGIIQDYKDIERRKEE